VLNPKTEIEDKPQISPMTEAKVVSAHSHENSTGTKKHDVVFESAPSEEFYNTAGIVHGGYAMTLLDTCMGIAVYSTLGPAIRYTSVETKVKIT
jgi:hypothetical protein